MKKIINNDNNEVIITIEVDDISSFDTLNQLADAYVEIASKIDEYRAPCNWHCPIEINVITPEGYVTEEELFTKFTTDPILERKAVTFIDSVTNHCKTTTLELWGSEEDHLGEPGAYALCMYDEKYIPLYIELLLQNDLDHEVYQFEHIKNIVEKYGLTSNVIRLLANRVTVAHGQSGCENIENHYPQLMELFINQPEQKSLFLNTAIQSIYFKAIPYGLNFDKIQGLTAYIPDDNEKVKWLAQQKEQAKDAFKSNISWE